MPLSPIDYAFLGESATPIEFLFRFDSRLDAQALRGSLAEVLESFGPATSVLKAVGPQGMVFEESSEGYSFTGSETPIDPELDASDAHQLLDPVHTTEGQPLSRFRLTVGPTRSILGVSISHAVVDGYSFFYLLASWAAHHRGESFRVPRHDRGLLRPTPTPLPKLENLTAAVIRARTGLSFAHPRSAPDRGALNWTKASFSLAELRAAASAAGEVAGIRLSVNDLLVARLWKRFGAEWSSEGDRRFVTCPTDFRRYHPAIGLDYFGNAIRTVTLEMAAEALADAEEGVVAVQIHQAIAGAKREASMDALNCLTELRLAQGLEGMERLHVVEPQAGLLVTNLSRMPLDKMDFGTGAPTACRIMTPVVRGAAVLATPDAPDRLDVHYCPPVPGEAESRV